MAGKLPFSSLHPFSEVLIWTKVDPTKSLISLAAAAGFGCIDVNIPKDISPGPEDDASHSPRMEPVDVQKQQSTLLASYIWDNYIAPSDVQRIFFIGIGNAFQGIARLLSEKQEVHESVGGVVAFIAANPLRPVSNDSWEGSNLARWYSENSLVWVSPTHSVWKREKRTGKKFGLVRKSEENVLGIMVKRHLEETWRWIEGRARQGDGEGDETEEDDEGEVVVGAAPISVPVLLGGERVIRDGEDVLMHR